MTRHSKRPIKQRISPDARRIEEWIAQLTMEEKASLCSGKDVWNTKAVKRLNIPGMLMADGPHGVRKQIGNNDNLGLFDSIPATCFPTASALAASWNRDLLEEIGVALAEECQQEDVSIILGPGINIKRSPLCGRNFEYFSEDPFLSAELASSMVLGIQSKGVSACLKHFAVNNQEKYRMIIDAIVDERALNEIYLYAFSHVIAKANPWAVMGSYNRLNGEYAGESVCLIHDILRRDWGYQGLVISDWGATNNRVLGLAAGMDLEMPSSGVLHDPMIVHAVKSGQISPDVLDDSVRRILQLLFHTKEQKVYRFHYSPSKHHVLAKKAASECIVLLKNDRTDVPPLHPMTLLPLQKGLKIALIGRFAKHPRYQGVGSSNIHPTRLENMLHYAKKEWKGPLTYSKGYSRNSDQVDRNLLSEAIESAIGADVAILMVGLPDSYESEGFDRIHLKLPPSHEALIEEISAVQPNVIVVLSNGAPVEMSWAGHVPCIVEAYLLGQAGAGALWDVLTGKVNPSGKIAETFPLALEDTSAYPYFPMGPRQVEYRESIFVGYRFYEKVGRDVLFPFGHGLSYTTFKYQDLVVEHSVFDFSHKEVYWVSITVENTGNHPGKETVQLYTRDCSSVRIHPEKELKGFEKVFLHPKEKKRLSFFLDQSSFSYYSTPHHSWEVVNGEYRILAGSSSKDVRMEACVEVRTKAADCCTDIKAVSDIQTQNDASYHEKETVYFTSLLNHPVVTREEFYQFLGKSMPVNEETTGPYHFNSTIEECQSHWLCRLMYNIILLHIKKMTKGNPLQLETMKKALLELPLRGLALMSNGAFSYRHLDTLILWINRKRVKAIQTLFFH